MMGSRATVTALAILVVLGSLTCPTCLAADEKAPGQDNQPAAAGSEKSPLATGLVALGAALAVGVCALATGIAQSRIGAAGCGTLAEKPEVSGTIILLVAIPETMVILGFVVAVVLLFAL